MANRRTSWRKPSTQPRRHRLPFSGIEDPALLTLFTHLLAKRVNVNAVNGAIYTGLFVGTTHSPSNDLLLTLRYARLVRGKPIPSATVHDLRGSTAARIHIPFSRVTTVLGAPLENNRSFATDTQITRGSTGAGRQLQRFQHFDNLDQKTFGELANSTNDKWDQFHVNQTKFGVTTSFDETQYTTVIDRNSKDFEARQRAADRLAEEIESTPSQNVHVREERNQDIGNELDEEARFSGVQRPQNTQQARVTKEPEKPRLSYAAAAAVGTNVEPRQHLAKPPSAGATHGQASANKPVSHVKNSVVATKPAPATVKHSQHTKISQEQTKQSQAASRGAHSASVKSAPANGRVTTQTPKSVKKGPATTKPQQHQGKNAVTSKASGQSSTTKSGSQSSAARPSTSAANPKSSSSTTHAKTPASTRATTPSQPATAQEQPQAKSSTKTTTPTPTPPPANGTEKPVEEKSKSARASRDNLPQMMKVRTALAGRTSPNQSRNSPLPTPAVSDTSAIGVLNLDAQTPNLGPEQIKRFEAYKTKREFQSIAANREKITDDLKKFSTQLDSKNGSLRRGQNSGSSTPGTPRASVRVTKTVPDTGNAEEPVADNVTKKDATVVKESVTKEKPRTEVGTKAPKESKAVKVQETKAVDKSNESTPKPRPKSKSKLNPNAQEFKLNPDAPSFTPSSQKTQAQTPAPYAVYSQPAHVEYSQPLQFPPGYAMPLQAMTPMPYAPQSYVVVPTVPTPVAGGTGSAYPFVQQPPSFAPAHVGGRFPQSAPMPVVSYGYPPQVTPMVIAQPPQQRVPASPYYHNSYAGGQAGPGHMAAPHQAHLYQQGAAPHMQGGTLSMTGRGGHGNTRRGGANRSRGKTNIQQSYPHAPSSASGERSAPKSPEGARSPGGAQR